MIVPLEADGRRFWFRGFFALGLVVCAWWDDRTHAYTELLADEVAGRGLRGLDGVVRRIAAVSGIRFFSTEIALDAARPLHRDPFTSNETCDMRLGSVHADGVPDAVVGAVRLADRRLCPRRPDGWDKEHPEARHDRSPSQGERGGDMKVRGLLIVVILALIVVYAVGFFEDGGKEQPQGRWSINTRKRRST